MKKIIALISLLAICILSFVACAPQDTTAIRVGYMSGPTGMGMAKLINDNGGIEGNDKYTFTKYQNTELAKTDLTDGKIDMICIPTNEAAQYFNKTDKDLSVLAINTLGTLYIVGKGDETYDSLDDLAGKTIYTCKNGTPRVVLEALLEKAGVDATVSYTVGETEIPNPQLLAPQIMAGKLDLVLAPEPIVSTALSKNENYSVKLDIAEMWKNEYGSDLAMGCIVARNDFIEEHESVVKRFLSEYKTSINFVNDSKNVDTAASYVVSAGISDSEAVAKKSLLNLGSSISYLDKAEMKSVLKSFYSAIGINSPEDEFYYEG